MSFLVLPPETTSAPTRATGPVRHTLRNVRCESHENSPKRFRANNIHASDRIVVFRAPGCGPRQQWPRPPSGNRSETSHDQCATPGNAPPQGRPTVSR